MMLLILRDLWTLYSIVLIFALCIQLIRWTLDNEDPPKRKLKNYIAGAFMWPIILIKECWKLIK